MKKRKLGNSGIEVYPLAFGGNVFGWTVDEPMSFRLLDAFVDAGFSLIDTADIYSRWVPGHSGGESETIIGKWFQRSGKREKVVIATKVGKEMGPDRKGLSKSYILHAVEDSLKRLQTDHIDLYQDIVKKYMNDRGFRILEALDQVAQKHNATAARVALAWLIDRPGITAPIASATNLNQLNELIEATRLKLDRVSMKLLNEASA